MNNFHRPHAGLQEADPSEEAHRSPFSDLAGRFANWMTGADQLPVEDTAPTADAEPAPTRTLAPSRGPASTRTAASTWTPAPTRTPEAATANDVEPPPASDEADSGRFPLAPFGYNRTAVDEHVATLERELEELRAKNAPMASITDELERIGEQTASILVVAHDQANETTRLAQEQAERCVADAAANAVQMTADAKAKLRELDAETDAVWRERERLLEDVRVVSVALANLADQASERFPAEPSPSSTGSFERVAVPARGLWEQTDDAAESTEMDANGAVTVDPQATQPFSVLEDEGESEGLQGQPGDTGSWLVGLEPPDLER